MISKLTIGAIFLSLLGLSQPAFATPPWGDKLDKEQEVWERKNRAIVRQKMYYKTGKFEVTPLAGLFPYDSVISSFNFGGRLAWHLGEHMGWEILDFQYVIPSVTGFTTSLVESKDLSNLQATELNMLISTNFLLSPFYGKFRLFGSSVLHFDVYLSMGVGVANTNLVTVSDSGGAQITRAAQTFDPMLNVGFGFKIYMNRLMGLVIDFRDYVVYTEVYGGRRFTSNFSIMGGLSFYLPTFG